MTDKKRNFSWLWPIVISVIFALGLWSGIKINHWGASGSATGQSVAKQKLSKFIDVLDTRYVDEINTDSIVDLTVNEIMSNLDPHSMYLSAAAAEETEEKIKGSFVGIGVRYFVNNDTISVFEVLKGSPSDKAGLQTADRILYADNEPLFGENAKNTEALKGRIGSKVQLRVLRPNEPELIDLELTRGQIDVSSIDAYYMINEDLGYIKINRFSENTTTQFDQAITQLKKDNAKGLILDLRDNPGGMLDAAIHIADEFLPEDKLILFQKNKDDERKDSYATAKGSFDTAPVYILINENSASASEVVAGALQDNDTGVIVGRRSFGKGLVQQDIQLGDGSAVRLTVARYYTPTGRSIQRPYDMGNEAYFSEYLERYDSGELLDAENIKINDSLKYTTPKGKVVYGGGGIIPDVFVPSPEGYVLQTLAYFAQSGFGDQFVNEYLQKDGAHLLHLSQEDFLTTYEVSEPLMENFIEYAQLYNSSMRLPGYRDEVALVIKSAMAQQLFGKAVKVELLNQQDDMILKTIEIYSESLQNPTEQSSTPQ